MMRCRLAHCRGVILAGEAVQIVWVPPLELQVRAVGPAGKPVVGLGLMVARADGLLWALRSNVQTDRNGAASLVVAALKTVPASRRASWRVHRVGYGETVAAIAELYETTAEQIAMANGGVQAFPVMGDLLVVPVSYTASSGASRLRTVNDITP